MLVEQELPKKARRLPVSNPSLWLKTLYKHRWAYLFISPFFILFLVFFLYPTIQSFDLSLYKWEGFSQY